MKKSLVALAVLAASGATFAQSSVTLSGDIDFGYFATKTGGATSTTVKGFGTDTSEIAINVVEDLGGGLKLAGRLGMQGFARDFGAVTVTGAGTNQTISLMGGFGKVMVGSIEIGSGIRGLAQAGAPVNNMEGEVLATAGNYDIIKYTAPAMSGFTFSASHVDGIGQTVGLNSPADLRVLTVGVAYSAGPLKALLDYSSYTNSAADNRYRIAAQYDLGMAKVGIGYEDQNLVAGSDNNYTMLGVSAPIGASNTVGLVWTKKDEPAGGSRSGYAIGFSHDLSKRTAIGANYASWDPAVNAAENSSKIKLVLSHSF